MPSLTPQPGITLPAAAQWEAMCNTEAFLFLYSNLLIYFHNVRSEKVTDI